MSNERSMCHYTDCPRVSFRKTGPCYKHYHEEKGTEPNRGGKRVKHMDIDYNEFWMFAKKHIKWDGNGNPIGVKEGIDPNWRGEQK